jgi:hypothetical protein
MNNCKKCFCKYYAKRFYNNCGRYADINNCVGFDKINKLNDIDNTCKLCGGKFSIKRMIWCGSIDDRLKCDNCGNII